MDRVCQQPFMAQEMWLLVPKSYRFVKGLQGSTSYKVHKLVDCFVSIDIWLKH
jgi:hypothetical protein